MNQLFPGTDMVSDTRVFLRERSSRNTRITELHCSSCCTFLGASNRPEVLDFIQKVHICRTLTTLSPRRSNTSPC